MMVMPVDKSVWLDRINSVSRKASSEISSKGWVQDYMEGDNGEACIVSAGHRVSDQIDAAGMSHVLRELLDFKDQGEVWNDAPGRSQSEVEALLSSFEVTEELMAEVFGPEWALVCYLAQMFATFSEEEWSDWSSSRNEKWDHQILQHLDDQQEPLPQEVRARTAVCAAASHMAIEHNLNPMGPSVALMTSFIIRPSLQGALA